MAHKDAFCSPLGRSTAAELLSAPALLWAGAGGPSPPCFLLGPQTQGSMKLAYVPRTLLSSGAHKIS